MFNRKTLVLPRVFVCVYRAVIFSLSVSQSSRPQGIKSVQHKLWPEPCCKRSCHKTPWFDPHFVRKACSKRFARGHCPRLKRVQNLADERKEKTEREREREGGEGERERETEGERKRE